MIQLRTPPVPDLARIPGGTRDEAVDWLRAYYNAPSAPFNYVPGTLIVKQGYRGLHNLEHLLAGTSRIANSQSRLSNSEVVSMAAPVAFGRNVRVFDLPRRKFNFGRDLEAGFRIPFFFVEGGTIKIYYLQPRKSYNLTLSQLSMVATIHKRYLLDTEFFGENSEIEYVDLCANPDTGERERHVYSLSDMELWPEKRLADRLTLVAEAIDYIKTHELVAPRKRLPRRSIPDMPLFD